MSHVFTLKLPHPLLGRLESVSRLEGKSKGSYIRELLQNALGRDPTSEERVTRVTQALMRDKKIRVNVDWDDLRRQAMGGSDLAPEEEVRQYRRRGL